MLVLQYQNKRSLDLRLMTIEGSTNNEYLRLRKNQHKEAEYRETNQKHKNRISRRGYHRRTVHRN